MSVNDTTFEERRRSAALLAKVLSQRVQAEFGSSGKWRDDFKPEAIDEGHSASIIEFRLGKWPPRFRLSIHSDKGGSRIGYGVFRPSNMNGQSDDQGLREYLAARVSGASTTTPVHWAWYREVDEPLRDFSAPETLTEVEKIRRGEKSKADDAFLRARDDLTGLAKALDDWYAQG